jgi:hypothetical protein
MKERWEADEQESPGRPWFAWPPSGRTAWQGFLALSVFIRVHLWFPLPFPDSGTVPAGRSIAEGGDFKTVEQGAATSVWAATHLQLAGRGGVTCQDCDVALCPAAPPSASACAPHAFDPQTAERLWTLSKRLTKVKFEGGEAVQEG